MKPMSHDQYDVVIVGSGFAGMYMLHRTRALGLSVRVLESGSGVGGTWFWNRYPGARCDVESVQYSYQFSDTLQQEWDWSERYATGPEILRYANHVADRFDLRRDIQFNTRVTHMTFDEDTGRWNIRTNADTRVSAKFCIMATGCLSSVNKPKFKGLNSFRGETLHTGIGRTKEWTLPANAWGSSVRDHRRSRRFRSLPRKLAIYSCSSALRTTPCQLTTRRWIHKFAGKSKRTTQACARGRSRCRTAWILYSIRCRPWR